MMSLSTPFQFQQSLHQRPRRSLEYVKCQYCREAKQRCSPSGRIWPARCDRCINEDLPCAVGTYADGTNANGTSSQKKGRVKHKRASRSLISQPERGSSAVQRYLTTSLTSPEIRNISAPQFSLVPSPSLVPPWSVCESFPLRIPEQPFPQGDPIHSNDLLAVASSPIPDSEWSLRNPPTLTDDTNTLLEWFLEPSEDIYEFVAPQPPLTSPRMYCQLAAGYLSDLNDIFLPTQDSILPQTIPGFQLPWNGNQILGNQNINHKTLEIAVFNLVNNLVPLDLWQVPSQTLDDNPICTFLRSLLLSLGLSTKPIIERIYNRLPKPEAEAFKRNIFAFGIKIGALHVIQAIRQLKPAGIHLDSDSISYICSSLDFNILKEVLEGLISGDLLFRSSSTLMYSINDGLSQRKQGAVSSDMYEVFKLILELNGVSQSFPLDFFLKTGGQRIAKYLLDSAPNFKTVVDWIRDYGLIQMLAENLSEDDSQNVFPDLLQSLQKYRHDDKQDLDVHYCACDLRSGYWTGRKNSHITSDLSGSLCIAISRMQGKVINIFLRAGVLPNACCLIRAVRLDDIELVTKLLNACPKQSDFIVAENRQTKCSLFERSKELNIWVQFDYNTPYAEAIRRSKKIKQLFDLHVSSKSFSNNINILSCLVAASEVGDKFAIDKYLEYIGPSESISSSYSSSKINEYCQYRSATSSAIQDSFRLAINNQDEDIIAKLLKLGAEVTPHELLLALKTRQVSIFCKIFDYETAPRLYGRMINGEEDERDCIDLRQDMLIEATHWGEFSILDLLLRYSKCQPCLKDALCVAIRLQKNEIIDILMEAGITSEEETAAMFLKDAIYTGDVALLRRWLNRGANPCDYGILTQAINTRNSNIIRTLLTTIAERYPEGNWISGVTEVELAIDLKDVELVKMLVESFAYTNRKFHMSRGKKTWPGASKALLAAISLEGRESLEMMNILLSYGADPNHVVSSSRWSDHILTPFLHAIDMNNIEKVRLLARKANVNFPTKNRIKRTPLQLAVEKGNEEIVSFLLTNDADVNAPAAIVGGATALQLASIGGNIRMAELLLDRGAGMHAPTAERDGRTPFEGAAEHGRLDMMKLLIHHGALDNEDGKQQMQRAVKLSEGNNQASAKMFIEDLWKNSYEEEI